MGAPVTNEAVELPVLDSCHRVEGYMFSSRGVLGRMAGDLYQVNST